MRRNKLLILGAAFTLAITPLVVGCAEVASAMAFKDVKKNADPATFTKSFSFRDIPDGYASSGTSGDFTIGTGSTALTVNYSGINTKSKETAADHAYGYAMFLKNSGYVYSHNAIDGYYVSKVSVTIGSNSGESGKIGCSFSNAELTTRDSTVNGSIAKGETYNYTNSFTSKTYRNFSTAGANVQIDSFVITYTEIPDDSDKFTVTFNSKGGTAIPPVLVDNSGTATITAPTAPTKTGYTFAGWYSDENFEHEYNFSSPVTGDLTLYAKWDKVALTTTYNSSLTVGNGYRIAGEVTSFVNDNGFYIQDGNNVMYVFDSTVAKVVKVGNTVDLYGTFTNYQNTTLELTNVLYHEVTSEDTTISQTPVSNLNNVNDTNLWKYVEISGIQLGTGFYVDEQNRNTSSIVGSNVELYYSNKKYVNNDTFVNSNFVANDYVAVKGIVSKHGETNRIWISSIEKMEQYYVTFNTNGGSSVATQTVLTGNKATQPSNPTKEPDEDYTYTFAAWYDNEGLNGDPFDFNTPITSNLTLYAKWTANERPAIEAFEKISLQNSLYFAYDKVTERYTDALNRATTGNEETSYTDWADKTATTTVEYSGNSAGGNSSIQLRSSGNSGVIVTSNDDNLKATSITFKFNKNTANSRQIDVYGKHNAYSATSELYSDDKGTLIGSVKKVAPGEGEEQVLEYTLEIDKYYEFIGFRSNDGALWLDSVEISWKEELFDFTKAGIRFNTEVTKSLWGKINEQNSEHPISRYGTFVAKKSDFDVAIDISQSMDEAIELLDNDVENFYVNVEGSATPYSLNETTYKWAAYKPLDVSAANFLTTAYTAVSYVVVNNNYYYTNTKSVSLKDVAADYLENQGYEEDDADGSLYYLANL